MNHAKTITSQSIIRKALELSRLTSNSLTLQLEHAVANYEGNELKIDELLNVIARASVFLQIEELQVKFDKVAA